MIDIISCVNNTLLLFHCLTGFSLPCDPGYICLTGSDVPNPTDHMIGYICPPGHYCIGGAVAETPCAKGDYQPEEGKGRVVFKLVFSLY